MFPSNEHAQSGKIVLKITFTFLGSNLQQAPSLHSGMKFN